MLAMLPLSTPSVIRMMVLRPGRFCNFCAATRVTASYSNVPPRGRISGLPAGRSRGPARSSALCNRSFDGVNSCHTAIRLAKPTSRAWSPGRRTSSKKRAAAAFSVPMMPATLPLTSSSSATVIVESTSRAKCVIACPFPSCLISKSSLFRPLTLAPRWSRTLHSRFTKSTSTMIGEAGFGGLKSICPPAGHGAPSSMNAVSSVFMGMTPKIHGDRVQRGVKLCGPAMLRLFCALTLLIPAVAASAAAQDPQPPVAQLSPPVLRITVLMIQVDAVVTDSAGKHVAGLRPEDFEILQDGVSQKLTYFSYEPGAPPLPLSEAAPDPNSKPAAKVPVDRKSVVEGKSV